MNLSNMTGMNLSKMTERIEETANSVGSLKQNEDKGTSPS